MSERWHPVSPEELRIEDLEGKETLQPKPVTVIDDNPGMHGALGRVMDTHGMTDATLVFAHLKPKDRPDARRSDNHGIDVAIKELKANPEKPLIVYGIDPIAWHNTDYKLHFLLGHSNCRYIQVPSPDSNREMSRMITEIKNSPITVDPLSAQLLDVTTDIDQEIGGLLHDYPHAQGDPERVQAWLARAAKLGFSDQIYQDNPGVVYSLLKDKNICEYKPFAGQTLPGTFVDVEGTLITKEELNTDLVEHLKTLPPESVTIWTGGDVKKYAKVCQQHDLPWKILPKQIFREVSVEHAIDDLDAKTLKQTYGIHCQEIVDPNLPLS